MAQLIKAQTASLHVDYLWRYTLCGSQCLGIDNTNPKADPERTYMIPRFTLLDSAIANFNKVTTLTPLPTNDLYYVASTSATAKATSWRRAAKSLKLKLLNQVRLVDNTAKTKIDALMQTAN